VSGFGVRRLTYGPEKGKRGKGRGAQLFPVVSRSTEFTEASGEGMFNSLHTKQHTEMLLDEDAKQSVRTSWRGENYKGRGSGKNA